MRLSLALALLASGCATLAGQHHYVAIDSTPRGLEVRDASGTSVGTTPLFTRVDNGRDLRWTLVSGEGPRSLRVACDYRWGLSLAGNLFPAAVASAVQPVAGLAAMGVANAFDFASGKAWGCPLLQHLGPEPPPVAPEPVPCARVVVAPPKSAHDPLSRRAARAVEQHLREERACAQVGDPEETRSLFLRFGATHENGFDVSPHRREQLNELGTRTGATHVALVGLEREADGYSLKVRVHELLSLEGRALRPLTLDADADGRGPGGRVAPADPILRLLPNALSFSASLRSLEVLGRAGSRIVSVRTPDVPWVSALDNFTLGYEVDPDAFGPYSWVFRVAPLVTWATAERELSVVSARGQAREARVSVSAATFSFGPGATLVLPLGMLTAALAGGFALSWASEPGESRDLTLRLAAGARLSYTFFLTEHFFLRVRGDVARGARPFVDRREYSIDTVAGLNLAFGVFFPGLVGRVGDYLSQ